ncbi:MAG TPA: TonB C-terminal domain-containing protein [Polyangiaceae bacterium]
MSREQNVPLLLWVSTAILAHIATGGGAEQVARVIEDRYELRSFAHSIRGRLQPPATIEVAFENVGPPQADEPERVDGAEPRADEPNKAEKKKDAEHKPEKKIETPKIVLPAMAAPAPTQPQEQQQPVMDHRIAVKQHAAPDQEDNPTARFIGDDANHVKEESVAQITSHDQDDPNPTPGGHHSGPQGRTGDSDHDKIGSSDDHPGDPTHAPGESSKTPDTDHAEKAAGKQANAEPGKTPATGVLPNPQLAGAPQPSPAKTPAPPTPPAGGASQGLAPDREGYHLDPARPGPANGSPNKVADGKGRIPPRPVPSSPLGMLGLGGAPTPNGVNLNLTPEAVVAIVGEDRLTKERMADGERRKSAHRGSWQNSSFERWRSAIENYVSSVKPGNQTALNTARSPFGTYLVTIHNRIHPIFADDFLGSLDGLPANHPMNDGSLITRLEIVLDRDDGRLLRMGVVRTSGITAFDVAALDSVQRASPFGKPPKAIVSPDGNVYFHWEFHRDPVFACSTINARPYLLNTPPPSEPTKPKTPAPPFPGGDPREQQSPPSEGSRHGWLAPPAPRIGPKGRPLAG